MRKSSIKRTHFNRSEYFKQKKSYHLQISRYKNNITIINYLILVKQLIENFSDNKRGWICINSLLRGHFLPATKSWKRFLIERTTRISSGNWISTIVDKLPTKAEIEIVKMLFMACVTQDSHVMFLKINVAWILQFLIRCPKSLGTKLKVTTIL